jgi:hypothetical protein
MRFGVCWALGSPQPVRRFSTRRQQDLFKSTYVPVHGDPACWSCLHEERVSGVGNPPDNSHSATIPLSTLNWRLVYCKQQTRSALAKIRYSSKLSFGRASTFLLHYYVI